MPTSIKAALKKWEEATGKKAAETKYPDVCKCDLRIIQKICVLPRSSLVEGDEQLDRPNSKTTKELRDASVA